MARKLGTISISIEPDRHRLLKKHAEKAGHDNVSLFIRQWLDQFPFHKDDVVPVVIDVPKAYLGDRAALERYLGRTVAQLVDILERG